MPYKTIVNNLLFPLLVVAVSGIFAAVILTRINEAKIEDLQRQITAQDDITIPILKETIEKLNKIDGKLETHINDHKTKHK